MGTKNDQEGQVPTRDSGAWTPETGELITNSAFTGTRRTTPSNYSGHSYIFEKVRTVKSWSPREIEREWRRRVDILEYMKKIEVTHYKQVARIISTYYKNPDKIMKEVREVMSQDQKL